MAMLCELCRFDRHEHDWVADGIGFQDDACHVVVGELPLDGPATICECALRERPQSTWLDIQRFMSVFESGTQPPASRLPNAS